MDHQTLRSSHEELNHLEDEKIHQNQHIKSATLTHYHNHHHNNAGKEVLSDQDHFLQQFYPHYTLPPQQQQHGHSAHGLVGVRMAKAPLAEFDEKDFSLPPDEIRHKVHLFKALLIFFSTVILVRSARVTADCQQKRTRDS
jgi:cell envelope opacity-associated protein A